MLLADVKPLQRSSHRCADTNAHRTVWLFVEWTADKRAAAVAKHRLKFVARDAGARARRVCSRLASEGERRTGNAVQQPANSSARLKCGTSASQVACAYAVSTAAMASLVSRPRVFGGRPRDARFSRTLRCALPTATAAAGQAVGTTVSKYVQIEKSTLPGRAEAWQCTAASRAERHACRHFSNRCQRAAIVSSRYQRLPCAEACIMQAQPCFIA